MDIIKLDSNNIERIRYPAERLDVVVPNGIVVLAHWTMRTFETGYTTFATGDYLHEYFYTDRWFNIFALYNGSNKQLKGWYCNITRPTKITDSEVFWTDLALDVWVEPDGTATVLDEDEFEELGLDSAETEQCQAALNQLLALAKSNLLPQ